MRRWWSVAAALAVVLTVTLVWLAVGVPTDDRARAAADVAAGADDRDGAAPGRTERGRGASQDHGAPPRAPGPPPWAHGRGGPERGPDEPDALGKRDHREWLARWRDMASQERERMMRELARDHAAGMRAWSRCLADGRDDCEKPLPPGLAKKQPEG